MDEKKIEILQAKEVERYLKEEKRAYEIFQREPKLLILGSSDSGKSTLLKQIRIIHGEGFSREEKLSSKNLIRRGVLSSISILLQKIPSNDAISSLQNSVLEFQNSIEGIESSAEVTYPQKLVDEIISAWKLTVLKNACTDSTIGLHDTAEYFFDRMRIAFADNYSPTNDDILNLREATKKVIESKFMIQERCFHFYDVSGLSNHRKTWIPYFDIVDVVLFVAALSCFDQNLAEDSKTNRMVDSIQLFKELVNNKILKEKYFVLFLNKRDLFEKKARKIAISEYFPDYHGIFY